MDERAHDLAGRPTKRERRALSKSVWVKVAHELAKGKTRIPSARPVGKVEERMRGRGPPHLSALSQQQRIGAARLGGGNS